MSEIIKVTGSKGVELLAFKYADKTGEFIEIIKEDDKENENSLVLFERINGNIFVGKEEITPAMVKILTMFLNDQI